MGHLFADVVVRGNKGTKELNDILIDTGATFTVLPQDLLEEIDASKLPTESEVELGDGRTVKTRAYGVGIKIQDVEAPAITITFDGAPSVIGVETLESIGLKLDPTTGKLEFTRPKGLAYFYACARPPKG